MSSTRLSVLPPAGRAQHRRRCYKPPALYMRRSIHAQLHRERNDTERRASLVPAAAGAPCERNPGRGKAGRRPGQERRRGESVWGEDRDRVHSARAPGEWVQLHRRGIRESRRRGVQTPAVRQDWPAGSHLGSGWSGQHGAALLHLRWDLTVRQSHLELSREMADNLCAFASFLCIWEWETRDRCKSKLYSRANEQNDQCRASYCVQKR